MFKTVDPPSSPRPAPITRVIPQACSVSRLCKALCAEDPSSNGRAGPIARSFLSLRASIRFMHFVFSCLAGLILGLAPPVFTQHADTLAKEPALQENFYGVQILDRQVWVVGYYGTILHSKDKGLTWETQPSPTRNSLFQVRFLSGEGWISGSYGTVLYTTDGGKNWRAQATGTTEH